MTSDKSLLTSKSSASNDQPSVVVLDDFCSCIISDDSESAKEEPNSAPEESAPAPGFEPTPDSLLF